MKIQTPSPKRLFFAGAFAGLMLATASANNLQVGNVRPVLQAGVSGTGPALPVDRGVDLGQGGKFGSRRGRAWNHLAAACCQPQG